MSEEGQNRRVPDGDPVEEDPKSSTGDDEATVVGNSVDEPGDEQAEEVLAEVVDVTEATGGDQETEEPLLVVPEDEDEAEPRDEPSRDELVAELEDVRRERDEYLDNMRRIKAEMENSRRRLEKDRARLAQLASEKLVRELLPVLDNLERALEVEGDIREGVRATHGGLLAALGREGLEPVDSNGESFDPSVHEAVMGQPSEEHEEDTVIQTLERGYTMNGRTIRAAKVIVAKQV